MIRSEIYKSLLETLTGTAGTPIKYVDLWNQNVEFIEQEENWERPAVFVEFCPISWSPYANKRLRGVGTLKMHIVADWNGSVSSDSTRRDELLEIFRLSETVRDALAEIDLCGFDGVRLIETATNHNHEEIVENIDTYVYRCLV